MREFLWRFITIRGFKGDTIEEVTSHMRADDRCSEYLMLIKMSLKMKESLKKGINTALETNTSSFIETRIRCMIEETELITKCNGIVK